MPDIFDNLKTESSIGPALQAALANFDTCDVATGYFDLRGWASFADVVDGKAVQRQSSDPAVVRVLVGMVMPADSALMLSALQDAVQPPPYGSDLNDMGKALTAKEQLVKHLRTQLMRGLPSQAEQRTLQQLKAQLESGAVEMKVFTTAPLHGKTYIFHAPGNAFAERRAYVGSSNLTNSGFYKNLELNIDVTDKDASGKLADWFTDRWEDPFSLKITSEIIELIEQSWASDEQPTPYEVYLKVCHALSEDAREGLGYVLPPSIESLLLDYQETAASCSRTCRTPASRSRSRQALSSAFLSMGRPLGCAKTRSSCCHS